jgi:hypothetical protein
MFSPFSFLSIYIILPLIYMPLLSLNVFIHERLFLKDNIVGEYLVILLIEIDEFHKLLLSLLRFIKSFQKLGYFIIHKIVFEHAR